MSLRVAIQMDPIASINPLIESTLQLMLEASRRGHKLWYYTPDKLTWKAGKVTARAYPIKVFPDPKRYYQLGEASVIDLKTMDVVLMRQDPPYNMSYLSTTYMLEQIHPKTLVVNNPSAVRDFPEKLFPTHLRKWMPPTIITADITEIKQFRKEQKDIVIKPLFGHGGRAIFQIKKDDPNFNSLLEVLFARSPEPWVVQRYLPEMKNGERRIILVDGKFGDIAGRIPAKGETRASTVSGATYVKAKATRRHMEICEALGPVLKKNGLIFTGIDIIGDYLTEINITSPSSIVPIHKLTGKNLAVDIWNAIESYLP